MNAQEKNYIRQIIERAIADGCVVSVDNGEEVVVNHSRNVAAILLALGTVEEERLYLHNNIGRNWIGTIFLVYGNDPDEVVCDYGWPTDRGEERMKAIVGEYQP